MDFNETCHPGRPYLGIGKGCFLPVFYRLALHAVLHKKTIGDEHYQEEVDFSKAKLELPYKHTINKGLPTLIAS